MPITEFLWRMIILYIDTRDAMIGIECFRDTSDLDDLIPGNEFNGDVKYVQCT